MTTNPLIGICVHVLAAHAYHNKVAHVFDDLTSSGTRYPSEPHCVTVGMGGADILGDWGPSEPHCVTVGMSGNVVGRARYPLRVAPVEIRSRNWFRPYLHGAMGLLNPKLRQPLTEEQKPATRHQIFPPDG